MMTLKTKPELDEILTLLINSFDQDTWHKLILMDFQDIITVHTPYVEIETGPITSDGLHHRKTMTYTIFCDGYISRMSHV